MKAGRARPDDEMRMSADEFDRVMRRALQATPEHHATEKPPAGRRPKRKAKPTAKGKPQRKRSV
jgi:hypothetical protein